MEKLIWHTEQRQIKSLSATEGNPRQLTKKQAIDLEKSIKKFNLVDIPAINTDNRIISGHQRIAILKALGRKEEEIDVRVPNRHLTEEEHREYLLRANKNTGEWNIDLLANFDEDLLKESGWNSEELDDIFQLDMGDKDDEVPEVPEEPKSKVGDIYELPTGNGNFHRIMAGDAIKKEDCEKLMDGKKADMVFTDPPYNVNYTGGMGTHEKNKRDGILNDKMSKESFYQFLSEMSQRIVENVRGGVYICMSSSELNTLKTAWESNGGHWQSFIIWVKNNFTLSRADYQHMYEPILYGWADGIVNHYFSQDRDRANVWEDLRKVKTEFKDGYTIISFQGFKVRIKGKVEEGQVIRKKQKVDIWRHDKPIRSSEHPTMKPVALVSEALFGSSKRDDIVLDLFLGSGSTLIACEKANRVCYGMELDCHYVDVCVSRYCKYVGNNKVVLNGNEIEWKV